MGWRDRLRRRGAWEHDSADFERMDPRTLNITDPSLHGQVHGDRFEFEHTDTKRDWGADRYQYQVYPRGFPASVDHESYGRTRRFFYDPELTEPQPGEFRPEFKLREGTVWSDANAFRDNVKRDPGLLYRGISKEEWDAIHQTGRIESRREYNMGEDGTLYSTDPAQAQNYATGFAPRQYVPTHTHPGYVIAVPRPADAHPHPNMGPDTTEVVAPSAVPASTITHAWEFRPYAMTSGHQDIGSDTGGKTWRGMGSASPSAYMAYRTVTPGHSEDPERYGSVRQATIPLGYGDMYHVSPRRNRESILSQGLRGHERGGEVGTPWVYDQHEQPAGNYVFDNIEDARDYVYNLHSNALKHDLPEDANREWSEERYEQPEPPDDFHEWEDDAQDQWYDDHPYVESTDDPNGYDIFKVKAHGLPLFPDPETGLVERHRGEHMDLGALHDAYENEAEGYQHKPLPEQLHNDVGSMYGTEPKRYMLPLAVAPHRIEHVEHMPSWGLTQNDFYDRLDNESERQVPSPWVSLPYTERPMPGHESRHAGYNPRMSSDDAFQGWTNWHTQTVADALESNYYDGIYEGVNKLVERGATAQQLADFALKRFISKFNREQLKDAQNWNSTPEDKRPKDPSYEALPDEAKDLVNGIVGPPDRGDYTPDLIDPELVNWQEILDSFKATADEGAEYDRTIKNFQSQGLGWVTNHDEDTNKMRDAIMRFHGAIPEEEHGGTYSEYRDHPQNPRNIKVPISLDEVKSGKWDSYPQDFISSDSRYLLWKLNRMRLREEFLAENPKIAESLQWQFPDPEEREDRLDKLVGWHMPMERKDKQWTADDLARDPEARSLVENDPEHAQRLQQGMNQPLDEFTWKTIHQIRNGQAAPEHAQMMQQALTQRGYPAQDVQRMMAQQFRVNPETGRPERIQPLPEPQPQPEDPLLDKPGDFTLPPEWTARRRAYTSRLAKITPHFTTQGGDSYGGEYHGRYVALHPETGEYLGHVDYGQHSFAGYPAYHIKHIEVDPKWRRHGIATSLLNHMAEQEPEAKFDPGMLTDDGAGLHAPLKEHFPDRFVPPPCEGCGASYDHYHGCPVVEKEREDGDHNYWSPGERVQGPAGQQGTVGEWSPDGLAVTHDDGTGAHLPWEDPAGYRRVSSSDNPPSVEPEGFYHLTYPSVREQIAKHGLIPWSDQDEAHESDKGGDSDYVWFHDRPHFVDASDTWRIKPEFHSYLAPDLEEATGDVETTGSRYYRHRGVVPPHMLERVEQPESSVTPPDNRRSVDFERMSGRYVDYNPDHPVHKGTMDGAGRVHVWPVDHRGAPHHDEWEGPWKPGPLIDPDGDTGQHHDFAIENGIVYPGYGDLMPQDTRTRILQAVPGVRFQRRTASLDMASWTRYASEGLTSDDVLADGDSGNPVTVWGEHVGTPEAIDAIRQHGFDLSLHKRGTWGRGVYAHINGTGGTTTPGGKGGAKVPVQFTLNRPLHVALNYRSQVDRDHPGQQEFERITKGIVTPEEKTAALQAAGYDGVVVHKPDVGGLKPHVAVAFDPASVRLDAPHFPYGYREGSASGHTLAWRRGGYGRGLVSPEGRVITWPEDDGTTHNQMLMGLNVNHADTSKWAQFRIDKDGSVFLSRGPYDPEHMSTYLPSVDKKLNVTAWQGKPYVANILDPVQETLDPAVFEQPGTHKPRLKPQLREWLLDTIHNILEQGGYEGPERWAKLFLTGSLTTYQYAGHSDCDISIFVDHHTFPEWSRAEMIGLMVESCDGINLPGTPHPLQVYVVAKGIEPTDLYKPGLRSGYDLTNDKWVVPPERNRAHDVSHEDPEGYVTGLMAADKMDRLLMYEPDKAVIYYQQLHRKRMADQADGKGDYAPSNLIYKMLDNRGLFDKLRELGVKIASPVRYDGPHLQPQPGLELYRGEARPAGDLRQLLDQSGVGMHWTTTAGSVVHPQLRDLPDGPEGGQNVVWHATLEDPAHAVPRNHPMWNGKHRSMEWEQEVRLFPQSQLKINGAYVWRGGDNRHLHDRQPWTDDALELREQGLDRDAIVQTINGHMRDGRYDQPKDGYWRQWSKEQLPGFEPEQQFKFHDAGALKPTHGEGIICPVGPYLGAEEQDPRWGYIPLDQHAEVRHRPLADGPGGIDYGYLDERLKRGSTD